MLVCNPFLGWHWALYCLLPKGHTPPFSFPWWVKSCEVALWIIRGLFLASTLHYCALICVESCRLLLFLYHFHTCSVCWNSFRDLGSYLCSLLGCDPVFHSTMLCDQVAQHMHSTPVHPQTWGGCDTKLLLIIHSSWPGFCHFIHYEMHNDNWECAYICIYV